MRRLTCPPHLCGMCLQEQHNVVASSSLDVCSVFTWDYLTCCLIVSLMFHDNEMILAHHGLKNSSFSCWLLVPLCVVWWRLKLIFRDTSPWNFWNLISSKHEKTFIRLKTGFMEWPIYLSARKNPSVYSTYENAHKWGIEVHWRRGLLICFKCPKVGLFLVVAVAETDQSFSQGRTHRHRTWLPDLYLSIYSNEYAGIVVAAKTLPEMFLGHHNNSPPAQSQTKKRMQRTTHTFDQ